jgi:hypothetical protein
LGAQAATEFLIKFDWDDYKGARTSMQKKLNEEKTPSHTSPATVLAQS